MKSFGWFALCLVMCSSANAELDTLWYRQIQLTESSFPPEAATVLLNGTVLVVATRANSGDVDLWRYSLEGSLEWTGDLSFPGSGLTLLGLEQYTDGQIALFATYWSVNDSGNVVHLKRFSVAGEEIGENIYNLFSSSWSAGLASLADNTMMLFLSRNSANGASQIHLTKFNADGDTLWSRNVGFDGVYSEGRSVSVFENGDLLLAGLVANGDIQAFAKRVTSEGVTVWTRIYSSPINGMLVANSSDISRTGDIVVGGSDGDFWGGFLIPWAVGLDEDGNERWQLSNDGSIGIGVNAVRCEADGGAIIAGTLRFDFGVNNSEIYSVSETGIPQLEMSLGEMTAIRGISNDGTRGSVIFGSGWSDQGQTDGLLVRFGPGTTVQGFVRALGTNEPIEGVRVELLETNEFAYSEEQGIYNLGVSEAQGTLRLSGPCSQSHQEAVTLVEGEQNVRNFALGTPQFDNPVSSVNLVVTFDMWNHDTLTIYNDGNGTLSFSTEAIQLTPDSYTWFGVFPAYGEIPPNASAEIVVLIGPNSQYPESEFYGEARIHHNACPDTVNEVLVYSLALDTPDRQLPVETFALHPAYPNPFNAEACVAFDLPQAAPVTVKLYSIQGREVATLADRVYNAGTHELSSKGDDLATGVYLLRLTADHNVATQKLVLLK